MKSNPLVPNTSAAAAETKQRTISTFSLTLYLLLQGARWPHGVVFLGRNFTLTVLLFTQVYKWVPANMLGVTLRWTSIPSRGE